MTGRSRTLYERNRRRRVRVLPSGMAEALTGTGISGDHAQSGGPGDDPQVVHPGAQTQDRNGDLFATTQGDRANREAYGPKVREVKRDPVPVPGSVDLFCPRCGDRFPVGRVHDPGIEYRGTCGGCGWKFIYMRYSAVTQVLTIKERLR